MMCIISIIWTICDIIYFIRKLLNSDKYWYNKYVLFYFLGIINYNIQYGGSLSSGETLNCSITVLNNENVRAKFTVITNDEEGLSGVIKIENAKLWWPYLMHEEPGYMYTLEVLHLYTGNSSSTLTYFFSIFQWFKILYLGLLNILRDYIKVFLEFFYYLSCRDTIFVF